MTRNAEGNTRQRTLLIVLMAVLLIAAWRFVRPLLGFGGEEGVTVPVATSHLPVQAGHLVPHPGDRVAVLRMADLDRAFPAPGDGRDPWSFVDPPRPRPRPASKTPEPIAAERLPKVEEPQSPPQPAELLNFQYLGRFGPPGQQIAVFSRGREVFNKQEGEVIDNQFIVAHIGYESVDLRFVGFPDRPAKRIGVTPRRP